MTKDLIKTFDDTEIKKYKFHEEKSPISIKIIDIYKTIGFNKASFILNILLAIKILKTRPLCMFLQKMRAYRREFDETKYMSFLVRKVINYQKNIKQFGKKSEIASKENSYIMNLYIIKNI